MPWITGNTDDEGRRRADVWMNDSNGGGGEKKDPCSVVILAFLGGLAAVAGSIAWAVQGFPL